MPRSPYSDPPRGFKALRQRPFLWYAYDFETGHLHGGFRFRAQAVGWAWGIDIKRRALKMFASEWDEA